jgi:hypothetical protein
MLVPLYYYFPIIIIIIIIIKIFFYYFLFFKFELWKKAFNKEEDFFFKIIF